MTVDEMIPLVGGLLADAKCIPTEHREKVPDKGLSENWFARVHKPVKPEEVARTKEAQDAVNKEWTKLKTMKSKKTGKLGAWDYASVREKRQVMTEAIRTKTPTHFGSLMVLCHLKNAQLECQFWSYKGRVVLKTNMGILLSTQNKAHQLHT